VGCSADSFLLPPVPWLQGISREIVEGEDIPIVLGFTGLIAGIGVSLIMALISFLADLARYWILTLMTAALIFTLTLKVLKP